MTTLTIPDQYVPGLVKLNELPVLEIEQIVAALAQATVGSQKELVKIVTVTLPALPRPDAKAIVETLRSLYGVRTGMDIPVGEFVASILNAVSQSEDESVRTTDEQRLAELGRKLTALLSVRPLSMIAKARDLQVEYENVYCDSRVITDLRPVFDTDVKTEPAGFVLGHLLKLEFHRHGDHTELQVVLDKRELQAMIDVLTRAQEKAKTLMKVAEQRGLTILSD